MKLKYITFILFFNFLQNNVHSCKEAKDNLIDSGYSVSSNPVTDISAHQNKLIKDSTFQPEGKIIIRPDEAAIDQLCQTIQYQFKNKNILQSALRHDKIDIGHSLSSRGYQRLEFLGDAVLEFVIREYIWQNLQDFDVKKANHFASNLTNNKMLDQIANQLNLVAISRKLIPFNNAIKIQHEPSDYVESLVGALYIDGGLNASQSFISRYWFESLALKSIQDIINTMTQPSVISNPLLSYVRGPLSKHMFYSPQSLKHLEFLGEGILRFVIRDLLYHRFPRLTEGELSKKYDQCVSSASVDQLVKDYNLKQYLSQHNFKSFLGLLYTDQGIKICQDFILWYWTGDQAPIVIQNSLKRLSNSPYSTSSELFLVMEKHRHHYMLPSTKNILQEFSLINRDQPIYQTRQIKFGPIQGYETVIKSSSSRFDDVSAESHKKTDSEQLAAQKVINSLAVRVLYDVLNKREQNSNLTFEDYAIRVLETKLMQFGRSEFSYHKLAQNITHDQSFYRVEIQGQNIDSIVSEEKSMNLAKLKALAQSLFSLVNSEYLENAQRVSNLDRTYSANRPYLNFFKDFCETKLKALGHLNFIYKEVSKTQEKIMPVLTYEISGQTFDTTQGEGFDPLQAQLNALLSLLK